MLYHYKLGFPFEVKLPEILKVVYSKHAQEEAQSDRYGVIVLPPEIKVPGSKVIEVETCNQTGKMIKFVLQCRWKDAKRISYAIACDGDKFLVKTVWLNQMNDFHNSLDESKYDRPSKVKK